MGERALISSCGPVPISIVRPSIIESALAEPRPGWIRGFRMAEPVIISYARGLLKEFPGVPEGTVDVIPVDMVVATLIAVAAKGPDSSGPTVTQIASGSRNPLKYRQLVDLVRSWFLEHPLYDTHGQPIVVPEWSFPGRGRVQSQLERVTSVLSVLEKTVSTLPLRGKQASIAAQLETKRSQYERALGYVKLYGAYTETEACFRVDRLLELESSLDADDSDFVLDPAVIDWTHYVHDIHLPSIVVHARVKTSPGKKISGDRTDRATKAILDPSRHLAAFDLENTLIASNVVDAYAWLATRHLDGRDRIRESMHLLSKAPSLLMQDRKDRGDFLRAFYRRYEGADLGVLEGDAMELFTDFLLTRAFPKGLARVRKHRELGHKTLLITGALDFAIEGLKPLFDDVVAAKMTVDESGILTGELEQLPPTGEARALVIQEYASAYNLELGESVAYADSASDLAMLEAVGFPVAVNPEAKLAAIARRRGWHVEQWPKSPGSPRRLLPIGPPPHPGQNGPWQGALGALGQAVNMASSSVLRSLEKRK
ncbi:MAG: HAD-IB family phosphatase [Acidimicrobiales bacterium]|nr:HAD-IB family phosphatase [Acidimicrobiales bacterium]